MNPMYDCLKFCLRNVKSLLTLQEIQLEDYDCFTNIQDKQVHRGVAIYVKKSLAAVRSPVRLEFSESTQCEIPLKTADRLLVKCIYTSPYSSTYNNDQLNNVLHEVC